MARRTNWESMLIGAFKMLIPGVMLLRCVLSKGIVGVLCRAINGEGPSCAWNTSCILCREDETALVRRKALADETARTEATLRSIYFFSL